MLRPETKIKGTAVGVTNGEVGEENRNTQKKKFGGKNISGNMDIVVAKETRS